MSRFELVRRQLRFSDEPDDRKLMYFGNYASDNSPVLLLPEHFNNHGAVSGGAGTGKTTLILQAIAQLFDAASPCSIVVIDGKADTFEILAQLQAVCRDVKYITLAPHKASYRFNPFDQPWYLRMPPCLRPDYWSGAFNLNYGIDWSQAYFAAGNTAMLDEGLIKDPNDINTYEAGVIAARTASSSKGGLSKELKSAGSHVEAILRRLKHIDCLHGQSTVDLADLFRKRMCLYVALPMSSGADVNRYVGTMILQAIFAAAASIPRKERHQVYVIVDESSRFAGRSSGMMLQQARSMQISMLFAYQSFLDLKTQTTDLGLALESNAALQWIFSATTPEEQRRILEISGETVETLASVRREGWFTGELRQTVPRKGGLHPYPGTVYDIHHVFPLENVTHTETVTRRLNVNELNLVSSHPLYSLLRVREPSSLGAINIMHQSRHLSAAEYKRFVDVDWPSGNDDTTINSYERTDTPPPPDEPPPPKNNIIRPKKGR